MERHLKVAAESLQHMLNILLSDDDRTIDVQTPNKHALRSKSRCICHVDIEQMPESEKTSSLWLTACPIGAKSLGVSASATLFGDQDSLGTGLYSLPGI